MRHVFVSRYLIILLASFALPACSEAESTAKPAATTVAASSPAPVSESNSESSPGLTIPNTNSQPLDSSAGTSQEPAPVYRPLDRRPVHDDAELARRGIHRVESRRLILYSDLPKDEIASLPGLVDELYKDWVAYFGELPPDRNGGDFQITGYLIQDEDLFRQAGLLPVHLPYFEHGRTRGRRFWMREQPYEFYREHLLLHEATHCFMTVLQNSEGPAWYMEGMAEYFGLHRRTDSGEIAFGVIPPPPEQTLGFDRIEVIEEEIAAGDFMTLDEIGLIRVSEFVETRPYAWSWAVCLFFNKHPDCRGRFREVSSPALRSRFREAMQETFGEDAQTLRIEWAVFAHNIMPNYDFERTVIAFPKAAELELSESKTIAVAADQSWQASGIRLLAGRTYRLESNGEATLAQEPQPWISHPEGITFDYAHAAPLGRLQAAILVDDLANSPDPAGGLLSPIDIGRAVDLTPTAAGQLYFRINDRPNNLANNRGSYQVRVIGE